MEEHKELQLLPAPQPTASSSRIPSRPSKTSVKFISNGSDLFDGPPPLDLQLSISVRPMKPLNHYTQMKPDHCGSDVEALRWQAAEQIRLAAVEKAYAERVREMTRREMELAQSEFARARHVWERAREEVERAERLKERAIQRIDSTCMEITCHSCRQRFRP